jgi:carboxypeptidase PM20D1
MRRALAVLALVAAALGGVLVARALLLQPPESSPPPETSFEADEGAAATHLAEAIRFPTLALEDPDLFDVAAFAALREWLVLSYPAAHASLERELIGGASLLYTWPGRDPTLAPLVLMGHLDVVPVDPGSEAAWTHGPFDGVIADGFVWGRGALDDKISVVAIMEAVEALIGEGFTPARTVYLAFGHDEELGGLGGARLVAEALEERGMGRAALVVDEGGTLTQGFVPGVEGPVALVGVAEKGFLSLALSVRAAGGHSSMPPRETAISVLARALTRLEEEPFPSRLDGPARWMLDAVGPRMPLLARLGLANLWLFEPLVTARLAGTPSTAAMVRTTTAPTMIQAGIKENVLPIQARAVVNFRILPGETRETVSAHVRGIVSDPRVEIAPATPFATDPSPVSDPEGPGFRLVASAARQAAGDPELTVAPYLVVGGTDSRYYADRAESVLRFVPVLIRPDDLSRVHGTDERVATADVATAVRFFHALIRGSDTLR